MRSHFENRVETLSNFARTSPKNRLQFVARIHSGIPHAYRQISCGIYAHFWCNSTQNSLDIFSAGTSVSIIVKFCITYSRVSYNFSEVQYFYRSCTRLFLYISTSVLIVYEYPNSLSK